MATYHTPGVYVEEIAKLPPTVASVETAIPAFIGYTSVAVDIAPDDLILVPKRIGSLVEYNLYYGMDPSINISEVNIDDANNFKSAEISNSYFMYDSLRLFYANGGGDCYIVSVGKFGSDVEEGQLTKGIDALLKKDEPTILLFPDAVVLTNNGLYNVQKSALIHCSNESRRDRMAILDTKENDPKGIEFRSQIGVNFLSYGAAYTPWLKINLPKNVTYNDIVGKIKRNGAAVTLQGLTADTEIKDQISELENAYNDKKNIVEKTNALASPSSNLRDRYASLVATYNDAKTVGNFQALMQFTMNIVGKLDDFVEAGNADLITNSIFLTSVKGTIASTFKPIAEDIIALDKAAKAKWAAGYTSQATASKFTNDTWSADFVGGVAAGGYLTAVPEEEDTDLAINILNPIFDSLTRSYLLLVVEGAKTVASTADKALEIAFPVYKTIKKGISTYISNVPPSGAIAGIYAMVDGTRGVWKAPANVSLNNVVEPVVTFSKTELDALNVDVVAGKSINAIRSFFGKGTLVYGGRTLAGNDNEWRYVHVRRLFIMVEESVKKASEFFVFEPNDANTWVKVQAMIENFLFNIWRQGALQGAKPEHAFYVAVGLNKTMNPIDILEGKMIIEIGMAAVRPAEFIVLRFSHMMATS